MAMFKDLITMSAMIYRELDNYMTSNCSRLVNQIER